MAIEGKTEREIYVKMKRKLSGIVPDFELKHKAGIVLEINRLKKEKNAVILGHNYMEPALYHTVPDFVGDSLELSRMAAKAAADVIVFCGVRFMAETAKILNPGKTVLIPSKKAGCSLAESVTAADVRELKRLYPGVPVVSYVNTSAEVKAESDVCCTSGKAGEVVKSLKKGSVIFIPDEYLARNTARELGWDFVYPPEKPKKGKKTIIGWKGRCEVHEKFTVNDIENARKQFPGVSVVAHPECSPEVVQKSDFSGSTSAMINYVRNSNAKKFLLLTECCMGDNITAETGKEMVRACSIRCPHMNEITLEETLKAMQKGRYKIELPEETIRKAKKALERMLEV